MTDWIEAGAAAPDFTLSDQDGRDVSLSDFTGRPVAIYFYPKDFTPGCTKQACNLRDHRSELEAAGVTVLGISPDPVESHERFRAEHGLNFTLLADPDHEVAERYGAWREKNMYGKKFMGINRSTFLIDADGTVAKVWKRPKVDRQAEEILEARAELLD